MKIKTDFITNSSSTSYTIIGTVTGHLPPIGDLKKLENFFDNKDESNKSFVYDNYVSLYETTNEEEDVYGHKTIITLDNTTRWVNTNNVTGKDNYHSICAFQIFVSNGHHWDFPTLKIIMDILNRLDSILQIPNLNAILNYSAMPVEVSGDGWDGGDPNCGPQCEYAWTKDLYENESQMGIIHWRNGHIGKEIIKLRDNRLFMEDTIKLMLNEGANLK